MFVDALFLNNYLGTFMYIIYLDSQFAHNDPQKRQLWHHVTQQPLGVRTQAMVFCNCEI